MRLRLLQQAVTVPRMLRLDIALHTFARLASALDYAMPRAATVKHHLLMVVLRPLLNRIT